MNKTIIAALFACGCQSAVEGPTRRAENEPVERLEDDGDLGPPRDASCPSGVPFVATVKARVVDPSGAGIADARVQLCVWTNDVRMLCLEPGRTDASGDTLIDVTAPARCMTSATARVLLPASRRPALYCNIDLSLDDASLTIPDPYVLVEAPAPVALPDVGDPSSTRAVDLGAVAVDVTPSAIGTEAYARLAATRLSLADAPACLSADAPAFDALYAFAPEVDVDGTGFTFSVENTLGLAPFDEVGLHVQGGIDCKLEDGTLLEKGEWHRNGSGIVDESGARIHMERDSALPCLGWIGLMK